MTVIPFPEPRPKGVPVDQALRSIITSLLGVFGDMTVGDLLEAIKDMPMQDALTALVDGSAS